MQKLMLIGALALVSFSSFADSEAAIRAFLANEAVMAAIADVSDDMAISEPSALLISESSGFVGCMSTYLIAVTVKPKRPITNPQTRSIIAKVELLGSHPIAVKLLPANFL